MSVGPLLFALPLQDPDQEWRYALVADAPLSLTRTAMPTQWDWPLEAPVTVTAKARRISNFDDVWTLPMRPAPVPSAALEDLKLVPYGAAKVFKISMFPYVL